MSAQAGAVARLSALLDGRAQALGLRDGGAVLLRVRRGWCLSCAVVRSAQDGPRPDCGCAQRVQMLNQRSLYQSDRLAADRVRLGWCEFHAQALPASGSPRPADCPECRAGLPDLVALEAQASTRGFWMLHPVEPATVAPEPVEGRRKAAPALDVLRDIGPEVARGFAPLDLSAQGAGLHPFAGSAAWAEVQALRQAQALIPAKPGKLWRRARDLQRRADALAQALPALIADARGDSASDVGKARLVRLMLARQFLPDCPEWPQDWPCADWLRFAPGDLWAVVFKGWLSVRQADQRAQGLAGSLIADEVAPDLVKFGAACCAAWQGAADPWACQSVDDLRALAGRLSAYADLQPYSGE